MCGAVSGCGVADAMREVQTRLDELERTVRETREQLDQTRKEIYPALHYEL